MKFHLLTYQNNYSKILKYSVFIIFILILSFKANTEIPEKYKIETSLPKCKGTDYTKWTDCYGEYVFPRNEYKGEWKKGNFHGQGVLREAWGGIYVGGFKNNLADGIGRQEEPDGSWWEGEVKNDLLNGKGVWAYEDGSKYEGQFVDSMPNGLGKYIDDYGSISEGEFKNFKLSGKGIFINWNGDTYKGNFIDGFLDGEGFFSKSDGTEVSGIFKKDYLNGQGIWKFENGDVAKGNFKMDLLDGFGTYTWSNGDKYEGQFKNGKKHGKGKYTEKNGYIYEGNWQNDERNGYGEYTYENNDKYSGLFKNNLRHGKGKYTYVNGNTYDGMWVKGFENGYGVFTWSDTDRYEGNWKDGWRTGKGKYFYESGTVYEGDFIDNISEGKGTITYSDGTKYVGEFKDGNEHGQGIIEYPNGDRYEGQFKDAYEHGKGKMVYANGTIYEGLWENGKEAEGKTTLAKFTTDEKYYALIIGNNNYEKLEDLDNAVNDAKDLEKVLKEKYGFKTTLLIDEKSDETENAIIKFTQNRDKNDNILIYYAGHGELIKKQKRGYWLPTDAGSTQDSKWLSNNNIKDLISSSDAKHILLVVDSCFSGSLMRGSGENKSVEKLTPSAVERFKKLKTRLVMTSGGNEFVADGIGNSKNSVFAEPLIKALKDNNDVIRSIELFQTVQNYVINNADQTPNHSLIHGTGHNGGEFLFFPKS
ncbi:caspase family protein [Candidatus Pelagibacter sp.]|nr:caspase family protein [Candidatus Pelagibacter sp.]